MLLSAQTYLQDVLFVSVHLRITFYKNLIQKKGFYLMSSIQKPPLPKFSIVGVRPSTFGIDFFGLCKRKCDKINKEIDEANDKALADFHKQLDLWKQSQY